MSVFIRFLFWSLTRIFFDATKIVQVVQYLQILIRFFINREDITPTIGNLVLTDHINLNYGIGIE
jgi:hypothetical protein